MTADRETHQVQSASTARNFRVSWSWFAACVLTLLTVAGQIRVWASDRGFWNDELYIGVNIKSKGFVALAGPLRYAQVAPPGWLMGEHAIYKVFGPGEQMLKLPQLLASIIVLVLTAIVAHRAIGRWAPAAAIALLALTPFTYYYAAELKQYSVEAAACLVVVLAVAWLADAAARGLLTRRNAIVAGVVFLAAVFTSYSALLVIAGAIAGVAVVQAVRRKWRALLPAAAVVAPALAYGAYQVSRRKRFSFLSNQDDFFPNGLPPHGSGPLDRVAWLPRMWQGFVANPMHWRFAPLVLLLIILGVAALIVRGRAVWAAVLAGPIVAAAGAAFIGRYPFEDRVALYLVAPVVLLLVAGLDGLVRWTISVWGRRSTVATALAAVLCLGALAGLAVMAQPAAVAAADEVRQPRYRDVGRDVFSDVSTQIRPGDVVLVYDFSQPMANWYGDRYKLPVAGLIGFSAECDSDAALDQALRGATRVWYIRGAAFSRHPSDYHGHVLELLAKRGHIVQSRVFGGGTIYGNAPGWTVVDLTKGPDPNPPRLPPMADPAFRCPWFSPDSW